MTGWQRWSLVAAIVVGALVRAPGVTWGENFPLGWYGHHVDEYTHLVNAEMIINPTVPPRWPPNPYPTGTAAHIAIPLMVVDAARGRLLKDLPSPHTIIVGGRMVVLAYGVATIPLVFVLARRLFRDVRVAHLATWLMALGGLHVSQSHFFLADVPAVFWMLAASYGMLRALDPDDPAREAALAVAAFACGAGFGVKLVVATLPSLAIVALWRGINVRRILEVVAYFTLGFVVVTALTNDSFELLKAFLRGTGGAYKFSRAFSALVYVIQFPSLISGPVAVLSVAGMLALGMRGLREWREPAVQRVVVAVIAPVAILMALVLFTLSNFLRHLIPLIPWLCMCAAWAVWWMVDGLRTRGVRWAAAAIVGPLLAYQALFVFDGERLYADDPRNQAAEWLLQNVPRGSDIWWQGHNWITQYRTVEFPRAGRPPVLVLEMHRANEFLSSMGWKNSFPRDRRFVFDGERYRKGELEQLQALFEGTSPYKEAARFSEHYFMPEFRLVESLLGNRSRNYLAEVVIFRLAM